MCLKFHAFCRMHRRRRCSLLPPKENQKSASDFDALDPRTRGCSPLVTPKRKSNRKKSSRFAQRFFLGSPSVPPSAAAAAAPPRGSGDGGDRKLCGLTGNFPASAEAFPQSGKGGAQRRMRVQDSSRCISGSRLAPEHSPSSLRDATSPEGGGFALLPGRCKKSSPLRGSWLRTQ